MQTENCRQQVSGKGKRAICFKQNAMQACAWCLLATGRQWRCLPLVGSGAACQVPWTHSVYADLFPKSVSSAQRMFSSINYENHNAQLFKLLRFYNLWCDGKPYPEHEQLARYDPADDYRERAAALKTYLRF